MTDVCGACIGLTKFARTAAFAVLFAAAVGCATPSSRYEACSPLPGWREVAGHAQGRFLIFGETHGTSESPKAVGEYVCAISESGARVLVGLELHSQRNSEIQTAWRAPEAEFGSALLGDAIGFGKSQDGRESEAMLAMLLRLHALKSSGRHIDLVAFNGARDDEQTARFADRPGQEPHEAAQAENIRDAVAKGGDEYDAVVVLVGNLHAVKEPMVWDGVAWNPMAVLLDGEEKVVSLLMQHNGGEAWNCRAPPGATSGASGQIRFEDVVCKNYPSAPSRSPAAAPSMALWSGEQDGDALYQKYDGYYFVGPITASPPAAKGTGSLH